VECKTSSIGSWEQYDIVDAGGGFVAFKAHSNNNYLSARLDDANKTVKPVATTIQAWEQFQIVSAGGGMVAFKANANGLYVQSFQNNTTTYPLLAQGAAIGSWETMICQ
jgi:hypothetical protein